MKKQTHFFINQWQTKRMKKLLFPVGLENLTTDLYFTSDDYLYHKKRFSKLNFKSPIPRQDFSYYLPVNKLVNDKVCFEKKNIEN